MRCQRQFAAGCEVELSHLAPDFQHHDANRVAGQRVGGRPQRVVHIGRAHGHEKAWIETKFGEPAHRHRARFKLGEILAYPHQWVSNGDPAREAGDKTGRRGALSAGVRKHFVHGTQREPALQRGVGVGMAERHPARRIGLAMRLDAFDIAAQSRKRARACAGHARRS